MAVLAAVLAALLAASLLAIAVMATTIRRLRAELEKKSEEVALTGFERDFYRGRVLDFEEWNRLLEVLKRPPVAWSKFHAKPPSAQEWADLLREEEEMADWPPTLLED